MDHTETARPTRDLAVDYYRVSGVVLIVFGHWLLSCVTYHDGSFGLQDPLADIPWTRWITWPLQAVPVFFLAAGYASAVSWQHWHDSGRMTRQAWVRNRLVRVLGPTGAYLAFISAVIVALAAFGVPGTVLQYAGWAVAMQLWFLAVYVLVVYLTPIAIAAQRNWSLWPAAVLGLGVIVMNTLEIAAHVPYVSWMNYLFCWGALYQLGIAWQGGLLTVRRAVPLAVVSAVALAFLISVGPFPVSMISVTGQTIQNSSPPSVAMLAFACAQTGLAVALAPTLNRVLSGPRTRKVLSVANANVMALYLWHMVPVVIVTVAVYPSGLWPQPTENSLSWWLARAGWILVLAAVTAVEMVVLFRLRRIFAAPVPAIPVRFGHRVTDATLLAGVALTAYGITYVSARGFAPDGHFPWPAILTFVVGAALVALTPRQRD
jgi:surface polysaccharide O-acyltransferase-like enzyme